MTPKQPHKTRKAFRWSGEKHLCPNGLTTCILPSAVFALLKGGELVTNGIEDCSYHYRIYATYPEAVADYQQAILKQEPK